EACFDSAGSWPSQAVKAPRSRAALRSHRRKSIGPRHAESSLMRHRAERGLKGAVMASLQGQGHFKKEGTTGRYIVTILKFPRGALGSPENGSSVLMCKHWRI